MIIKVKIIIVVIVMMINNKNNSYFINIDDNNNSNVSNNINNKNRSAEYPCTAGRGSDLQVCKEGLEAVRDRRHPA
jgi:hypothetical protein